MKKRVLVFGKFDILHPGHMHILKMAKKYGDVLVVLESDQAIYKLRNYQPYNKQGVRKSNLEKMGFQVFVRDTKHDVDYIIDKLKPNILCLGEDQEFLLEAFTQFKNIEIKKIKFLKSNLYKSTKLRSVLQDTSAGIYLIDKPKHLVSFKVVTTVRKALNIKRVGFSGTLDPLASGLLIVASGQATKLLDWFHDLPKVYQADIYFGQESDTYDLEGEIKINDKAKSFSKTDLTNVLKNFLGKQKQIAPIYSAKKVEGQKLYKLARAGKEVKAPSKEIEIYSLEILKFKYPKLSIKVSVSAGTYIRSLAHDLGQAMKTGALLSDLRRLSIGIFDVQKALSLEKVNKRSLEKAKIDPSDIIENLNESLVQ